MAIVGLATAVVLWVGLSGTAPVPAEDPADPAEDPAPETSTKVRKARKQPKPVAHQTSGPPRPLNVLLIVVDTLRADHLGAWGYERNTSPAIDGIAADGIRYTTGISQAPWTTPSMGALMTSLYPSALGILGDRSVLPDDVTLLPEILNDAGYRTGAVISHSFCSSKWNFDQGSTNPMFSATTPSRRQASPKVAWTSWKNRPTNRSFSGFTISTRTSPMPFTKLPTSPRTAPMTAA